MGIGFHARLQLRDGCSASASGRSGPRIDFAGSLCRQQWPVPCLLMGLRGRLPTGQPFQHSHFKGCAGREEQEGRIGTPQITWDSLASSHPAGILEREPSFLAAGVESVKLSKPLGLLKVGTAAYFPSSHSLPSWLQRLPTPPHHFTGADVAIKPLYPSVSTPV